MVVDDYYKQGKEINKLLQRDQKAAELGLKAEILFDTDLITVNLSKRETIDWSDSMLLSILHPTQKGRDHIIELTAVSDIGNEITKAGKLDQRTYFGKNRSIEPGEWIVHLETPDWRLTHRTRLNDKTTVLISP